MANPLTTKRFPASATVAALEFGLVTLIWGGTWLVIKGQLGVVPAVWSVAYRFIIASLVLSAIAVATGRWRRPTPAAHGFALVIGVAQFVLNFNLVYAAETRLASGLVALVFALLVVPNTILAAIFLKTRITVRFVIGATLGIGGLILLFGDDLAAPAARADAALGLVLVAAAVACASIANVLQAGQLGRSLPSLPTLALAMGYGAAIDATFATITVGRPTWDARPEYWLGLAYLALAASVVAFSVYYRLIRRIGPGPAAYSSVLVPVIALFLSTLFEGYHWTRPSAAGAALALAGLAIALGGRVVSRGRRADPLDNRRMPG